ncbi:MAG: ribbon-helix-helix protein, CopG family [Acidimicrobiia bacterium]
MPGPSKEFLVRVPQETYDRLKQLADEGDRPVTAEVRRALRRHLEDATAG